MEFLEKLPDGCPLSLGAQDKEIVYSVRFLESNEFNSDCFCSHDEIDLKKGKSIKRSCKRSSCSLFSKLDHGIQSINVSQKSYRKFTHYVELKIPIGNGLHVLNHKGHIDFWPYSHCDMAKLCVSAPQPLKGGKP